MQTKNKNWSLSLVLGGLALLGSGWLCAAENSVGTTSANFLKIPAHARASGMAEAFTAVSDDETGMMYNPAGLARAPRNEISATHIEWFQGIRLEHAGALLDLGGLGALGASLTWLQVGDLVKTERVGNGPNPLANFKEVGTFNPHDLAIEVAYSRPLGKRFYVGGKLSAIQQAIDIDKAWGVGVDAGAQIVDLFPGLDLGVMLSNLGSKIGVGATSFGQPLTINVGSALYLFNRRWLISADVEFPQDNKVELSFGTEVTIARVLALRTGWRGGFAEQLNFGGGLRVAMLRVDYAYSPFLVLGGTHRVTVTYAWGLPGIGLGVVQRLLAPLGYAQYHRTAWTPEIQKKEQLKDWTLRLIDASGQVVRTWQGNGLPPVSQAWDGKDENAVVLPDQWVKGQLTVGFIGGGQRSATSEAVELDSTPPQLSLDVNPKVVRPHGEGAVLIPATFSLAASDKHGISVWKLIIRDKAGKLFWSQEGQGQPPAEIIWDGTDGSGKYVESGSTYVAQFFSKDGPGNLAHSEPVAQIVLLKELKIQIASDALFDPGKADVKISAYHQLKDVVATIRKYKSVGEHVQIEGHTDNDAVVHSVYKTNKALSLARAEAVVKFMVDLLGMEEGVLQPVGYGDTRPIATNETKEGRLANRRVEVRIQLTSYE